MNKREATAVLKSDTNDLKLIEQACKVLIDAGFCPNCFSSLGEFQEGDYYHNAGRECPDCEEFYICGMQPEYCDSSDCHSDADSGL